MLPPVIVRFRLQDSEDMVFQFSPTEVDAVSNSVKIPITTLPDIAMGNGTADPSTIIYDSDISKIMEYVTIALFFMALIGNSLIFIVFSMKDYKGSLTAMMYRILALTDGLVVLIQDGLHTLPFVINRNSIPGYDRVTCKIFISTLMWFRAFSVWLMILICIERFVCVWLPHRAKLLNTKSNYVVFTCIMLSVTCLFYMPLTLTIDHAEILVNGEEVGICSILGLPEDLGDHMQWYRDVFDGMNLAVSGFLPFILVSMSNTAIICGLLRSQAATHPSRNQAGSRSGLMNRNVFMMLCISSTSVVLSLFDPIYILLTNDLKDRQSNKFKRAITFGYFVPIFDSINRFINIVIISVFGKQFRKNLRQLIPCSCHPVKPNVTSMRQRAVTSLV